MCGYWATQVRFACFFADMLVSCRRKTKILLLVVCQIVLPPFLMCCRIQADASLGKIRPDFYEPATSLLQRDPVSSGSSSPPSLPRNVRTFTIVPSLLHSPTSVPLSDIPQQYCCAQLWVQQCKPDGQIRRRALSKVVYDGLMLHVTRVTGSNGDHHLFFK